MFGKPNYLIFNNAYINIEACLYVCVSKHIYGILFEGIVPLKKIMRNCIYVAEIILSTRSVDVYTHTLKHKTTVMTGVVNLS